MPSTREVFAAVAARLQDNQTRLAGVNATFQFDLSGDDGGTFYLSLVSGQATVGEGAPAAANCTVIMSAADFKEMVDGKLNPTSAFMGGRLKLRGDMSLALKLGSLLQ